MTPTDAEPDDLDAAFEAIIVDSFGEQATRRRLTRVEMPRQVPPSREDTDEPPLTVLDAMDRADALDDEGWTPPPPTPMRRWPVSALICAVAIAVGLAVALLGLAGVMLPAGVRAAAGVGAIAGLAGLLVHALRRRTPPRDGDGAVV